ncbi:eukaryotic translation initiation factor, putative [Ixodes scapularis]|uniref:Eukaryotic translation initiation factor, putative n=1 Tax=Ixodes scapularis TaxID=6945 RepID=B7PYI8_IXOSC|nr:eukaryotic translation initiation factor, putative [Ixodes scapularis]|eukprot:XP_002403145.1 eukaryotic translation initiation factor, putative [Ixodes scapularis]
MKGVISIVSRVVLETPVLCHQGGSGGALSTPEYNSRVKKCLVQFRPLLRNYVKDTESMLDCLAGLEEFVSAYDRYLPSLAGILNWFYDEELLSEDAIIHWFEKQDPSTAEAHTTVRKAVAKFVKWLQEAEEESD